MVELIRSGEYTTSEAGELFGVARSTVYRAIQRSKQHAVLAATATATESTTTLARARVREAKPDATAAEITPSYRPRHGASEFPPVKRAARSQAPRQLRPEQTPQTGR